VTETLPSSGGLTLLGRVAIFKRFCELSLAVCEAEL